MTEFKTLSLSECAKRLTELKRAAVYIHVRPDGDAVGSSSALVLLLRQMGKEAVIASADPIPERLAFLTEGITVTDAPEGYTPISIDSASPSQLGALYEKGIPVLAIDHHAVNTPYCDNYTISHASSAGEVLFGIIQELEGMGAARLTPDIAERIYAAIVCDTGGFAYSNTGKNTHLAAAELVETGIDHADLTKRLLQSRSAAQIRAEGYVALNMKTSAEGRISYALLSRAERQSLGLAFSDFETAIDVVRTLRGSEISFVLKETDQGEFKSSLRSVGANVASVAALHGGGGHIRAAGCAVKADSLDEAEKILLSELSELL